MLYRRNFGTEMGTVCWDVVMRGLGCEGVHAKSPADVESALAKARDVAGPLRDGRGVERARASARGWRWWRGSGYKVTITEVTRSRSAGAPAALRPRSAAIRGSPHAGPRAR